MVDKLSDSKKFFAGIDAGSSCFKTVIIDEDGVIVGWAVEDSGIDFNLIASTCFSKALDMARLDRKHLVGVVATGYGRENVSYADFCKTEISCQAKGCFYYFPFSINIIDIGGQDNKIIKLNDQGKRVGFKMNRKCAAGTGAFIEEMALRLKISIKDMNNLASVATGMVHLGSFCTVFSATEVLEKIRLGVVKEDIVKGLFFSVIKRVAEMDSFSNKVVMTGGVVSHNPYLINVAKTLINQPILLPKYPQLTGAFGAALYATGL